MDPILAWTSIKSVAPGTIVEWIQLVVSAATLAGLIFVAWFAEKWGRSPALIFVYDETAGWLLRNVGNGAALDIIVARGAANDEWEEPVRVPFLAKDDSFTLRWLGHTDVERLGCCYRGVSPRFFTSVYERDIMRIEDGYRLKRWDEHQIERYWKKGHDQRAHD